jgi:glutamine phosphoribosylpyrophosphate amidotransferase
MIKSISATGRYMQVTGGPGSTYINNYSGALGVGDVRYNTTNQNLEVYDGNNWVQIQTGYTSVGLNAEAESLLDWARQKRDEELQIQTLAKSNVAIKDLLEQRKTIDDQISMVKTLVNQRNSYGEEVQTSI